MEAYLSIILFFVLVNIGLTLLTLWSIVSIKKSHRHNAYQSKVEAEEVCVTDLNLNLLRMKTEDVIQYYDKKLIPQSFSIKGDIITLCDENGNVYVGYNNPEVTKHIKEHSFIEGIYVKHLAGPLEFNQTFTPLLVENNLFEVYPDFLKRENREKERKIWLSLFKNQKQNR
jgi:hypothetical protein